MVGNGLGFGSTLFGLGPPAMRGNSQMIWDRGADAAKKKIKESTVHVLALGAAGCNALRTREAVRTLKVRMRHRTTCWHNMFRFPAACRVPTGGRNVYEFFVSLE